MTPFLKISKNEKETAHTFSLKVSQVDPPASAAEKIAFEILSFAVVSFGIFFFLAMVFEFNILLQILFFIS